MPCLVLAEALVEALHYQADVVRSIGAVLCTYEKEAGDASEPAPGASAKLQICDDVR